MTKKEFKEKAKTIGYKSYKDLVLELGYGRRYLNRTHADDKLPRTIISRLDKKLELDNSTIATRLKKEK